ncbi:MAG: GIY-YIG nuclease family protein [Bacteroidia bacterium]
MNTNKGKEKKFLIYKITNLLNNFIYIGAHTTYNINDKYFGSSKYLKKDVKLLGKENFSKEILFVFDNKERMMKKEAELVNKEFCHRVDTYNKMVGGISEMIWNDMATVKDKDGNFLKVYLNDPRYLSGELVPNSKGLMTVKDKEGNTFKVSVKDERVLNGQFIPLMKGFKHSEETCKNNSLKIKNFYENHSGFFKGKFHSKDSKQKMKKVREERCLNLPEKNSQFGTMWITNGIEVKKIKKDFDIPQGWVKGRK